MQWEGTETKRVPLLKISQHERRQQEYAEVLLYLLLTNLLALYWDTF
jgi:hypothetical protein